MCISCITMSWFLYLLKLITWSPTISNYRYIKSRNHSMHRFIVKYLNRSSFQEIQSETDCWSLVFSYIFFLKRKLNRHWIESTGKNSFVKNWRRIVYSFNRMSKMLRTFSITILFVYFCCCHISLKSSSSDSLTLCMCSGISFILRLWFDFCFGLQQWQQ